MRHISDLACCTTTTICCTEKCFFFMQTSLEILPKTNISVGTELPGPTVEKRWCRVADSSYTASRTRRTWNPRCFCPSQENGLNGLARVESSPKANYLGMATDTALPAPRSAIQRVSPAGSTPVGVLSPSLITVTLALSPSMLSIGDFTAAIFGDEDLTVRCTHAIRPLLPAGPSRYQQVSRVCRRRPPECGRAC
jgi:hypothetical protein